MTEPREVGPGPQLTLTQNPPLAAPAGRPLTTLHGITTVAQHEFRVRLRAGRWRWLIGAWFVVLAIFTAMLRMSIERSDPTMVDPGVPTFGGLMLLLLGLSLLVVPALTAQSVNGDRERGVLATLQVTLLSPAEIALGKLLAAWGVSLVFVAASLPMVAATMTMGGVGLGRVVPTLLVVAVELGVVCALAQCLSAVLVRTVTSAVLSYVTVFALTVGTLIAFGLALASTTREVEHRHEVPTFDDRGEIVEGAPPRFETYTTTETRSDKVWWLLAPNPFVILADAAPIAKPRIDPRTGYEISSPLDPLGEIAKEVRNLRVRADERDAVERYTGRAVEAPEPGPVWPYGLAMNAALGLGAVAITIRRLRTPARKLARGVRVA